MILVRHSDFEKVLKSEIKGPGGWTSPVLRRFVLHCDSGAQFCLLIQFYPFAGRLTNFFWVSGGMGDKLGLTHVDQRLGGRWLGNPRMKWMFQDFSEVTIGAPPVFLTRKGQWPLRYISNIFWGFVILQEGGSSVCNASHVWVELLHRPADHIFLFKIRSRFGPKLPSTNITYVALNIVICLETGHTTQMDPNGYFMLFL